MSRSSSFVEGVVFGVVAGFVAGVLLAPGSGEETRDKLRQIKDENQDLINDTKEKTETMVAKTMEAIEGGFEKLGKLIDERSNKGAA